MSDKTQAQQKQFDTLARKRPLEAAGHDLDRTVESVQRMRRHMNLPEWSKRQIVENLNSTHEELRKRR